MELCYLVTKDEVLSVEDSRRKREMTIQIMRTPNVSSIKDCDLTLFPLRLRDVMG